MSCKGIYRKIKARYLIYFIISGVVLGNLLGLYLKIVFPR